MTLVAVFAVMLVSFGTIAWPFFGRQLRGDSRPKAAQPWDSLVSQRDTAYQALKELEFEYNLGNLSDADYSDLRERYRSQAAGILQKLETEMNRPDPGDLPANISADTPHMACPFCSEDVEAADTYCWRCGKQLGERCPDCGEPLLEDDRFCAGCGRNLGAQV